MKNTEQTGRGNRDSRARAKLIAINNSSEFRSAEYSVRSPIQTLAELGTNGHPKEGSRTYLSKDSL